MIGGNKLQVLTWNVCGWGQGVLPSELWHSHFDIGLLQETFLHPPRLPAGQAGSGTMSHENMLAPTADPCDVALDYPVLAHPSQSAVGKQPEERRDEEEEEEEACSHAMYGDKGGVHHAVCGYHTVFAGGCRLARMTAVAIHESLVGAVSNAQAGSWSLCVDLASPPMRLLSSHLPHSGLGPDAYAEALYEAQTYVDTCPEGAELLWGLDANTQVMPFSADATGIVSSWSVGPIAHVYLPPHQYERSEQFMSLLQSHCLIANNTWSAPDQPTHVPWAFTPARAIDFMVSRRGFHPTFVSDIPAGSISDHRPLISTVHLGEGSGKTKQQKRGRTYQFRIPAGWTPLRAGQFKARARSVWNESTCLSSFLEDLLPLASSSAAPSQRTLRRDEDSRLLRALLLTSPGTTASRLALRQLQQHRRRHSQIHKAEQINRALSAGGGQWQKRNRTSQRQPILSSLPFKALDIQEHASFWQGIHSSSSPTLPQFQQMVRDAPRGFSPQELQTAFQLGDAKALCDLLRTFNPGTATGQDGLSVAVFLALPLHILDELAVCFRRIMEGRVSYPQVWRKPLVRLLPKTVAPSSPSEYRPISVNNIAQRLYSKWVYQLVKNIAANYPSQVRQLAAVNGNCAQNLTALKLLWNRAEMHQWSLAMLKVDIRKAFDSVEPEIMLPAMRAKGISPGLAFAVLDLHVGRCPCFCLGATESSPTPIQKGVAQGDPTSAWLFQISMEFLLGPVLSQMRAHSPLPCGVLMHALYMDDLLILSQSLANLEDDYYSITAALRAGGLAVAPAKTQWICTPAFGHRDLTLDTATIPCQDSICFVGCRFYADPVKMLHAHRAGCAWNVFLAWQPLLMARSAAWHLKARLLRATATCSGLWQYNTGSLTLAGARAVQNTEIRMAIKMLRQKKTSAESWGGFFARRWRHARSMLSRVLPSLPAHLLSKHHQSVGHLFRHHDEANAILYEGSPLQHMLQPELQGSLKVGRPRRWERVYYDFYGAGFPEHCIERQTWKESEAAFSQHWLRCWRLPK